jgi:hypothetical protein
MKNPSFSVFAFSSGFLTAFERDGRDEIVDALHGMPCSNLAKVKYLLPHNIERPDGF